MTQLFFLSFYWEQSVVKSSAWRLRHIARYGWLLLSHANIHIKADGRRRYLSTTRDIQLPSEHSHLCQGHTYCHFAKQRHTIILLHHCEARSYATHRYRNHRRHIHRPLVVLRVGLRAAIFTKCGWRQHVCNWLHTTLVNRYIVTSGKVPGYTGKSARTGSIFLLRSFIIGITFFGLS